MEPAAKKARGSGAGGGDDGAAAALSRAGSKRTVDNASSKAWQYNVIAWKSCEGFAERLQASDPQLFQYHTTVWEKFDDSKMDHIIVGGFRPKNLISRCGNSGVAGNSGSRVQANCRQLMRARCLIAGRTCSFLHHSTTMMPS
jgi:hypothetical protein